MTEHLLNYRRQRNLAVVELRKLLKAMKSRKSIVGQAAIIPARVPIVKCIMAVGQRTIAADISLGVSSGPAAVSFVQQKVSCKYARLFVHLQMKHEQ